MRLFCYPYLFFDIDGNPFPDGTKVIFYVDTIPPDSTKSDQRASELITEDASIGSYKIYMTSTEGFSRNIDVDLLDNNGNIQTVTITEVGTDDGGNYIKFTPALQFSFNVSDGAKVIKTLSVLDATNAASKISQATLLPASIGLVDATPIYTGKEFRSFVTGTV